MDDWYEKLIITIPVSIYHIEIFWGHFVFNIFDQQLLQLD